MFFNADEIMYGYGTGEGMQKLKTLENLSGELHLPLYMWYEGKMQEFTAAQEIREPEVRDGAQTGRYRELWFHPGRVLTPEEAGSRTNELTTEERKNFSEEAIAENPFPVNREAYAAYKEIKKGDDLYALLQNPNESNIDRYQFSKAPELLSMVDTDGRFRDVANVTEWLRKCESWMGRFGEARAKLKEELAHNPPYSKVVGTRTTLKQLANDEVTVTYQMYSVLRAAERKQDEETASEIKRSLDNLGKLQNCRDFESKRIDETGGLRFLPEEDMPREVRKRLEESI